MKIGFCCDMFVPTSGVDRICAELAIRLSDWHEVTLFTRSGYTDESWIKTLGLNVVKIDTPIGMHFVKRYSYVLNGKKIMKKFNFDVINAHGSLLGLSAVLSGLPTVPTYHPHINPRFLSINQLPAYILSRWEWESLFKKSNKIICISGFSKSCIKKFANKSVVIYNGIDRKMFSPDGEVIDLGENSILYVGSPHRHKRLEILFETLKELKKDIPDVRLFIIGKGHEIYSKKIKKLPIKILGTVPDEDLPKYYRGCAVFASASAWEGFCLPFVEAQACAKPVVGFNLTAIPEVIKHKKTGFLVNTKYEFTTMIKLLLTDKNLQRKLGKNARRWSKNFDWSKTVKNYVKVFKSL
jgi:glycosyltransferase involved in cell wall biosynthesis